MPVFNVHLPAGRHSREQRETIAESLSRSLFEALGLPDEDRFVVFSEHGEGWLFMHPTYMDVDRAESAMIVTVQIAATRSKADRRELLATMVRLLEKNAGVRPDDVVISLVPIPPENLSFGRGVSPVDDGGD